MEATYDFALIGAAGFVAPRHMKAIRENGSNLIALLDPSDSVGIIDSYFPDAHFFTEFERFDRHIDKLRRKGRQIDFMSICSPNYLHDSHARFAMRSGADAVCEKPLVLNPWNIDGLKQIESDTGQAVHTILQLRLHPSVIALREKLVTEERRKKYDVDLTYITARGRWYLHSWKGDKKKSGGIATNIGVHFFDMLHYLFGDLEDNVVHLSTATRAAGFLEYQRARVRWFLSLEIDDVPEEPRSAGQRTWRSITLDGTEFEFSGGFGELHTRAYEEILAGRGFGLEENRVAIETVADIRTAAESTTGDRHPFVRQAR